MTRAWPEVRLDEVAEVRLGRQRSPKNHSGTQMRPYVRAANVGWDGWRLDDVKQMNFTDAEMDTYRLQRGDLLLNEASGSRAEVGKPAIWNGEVKECAFQNTLLRVRPRSRADSRYLLHFFKDQAASGAMASRSRGVGIHHLGREALASVEVPLPPIEEQRRIAAILDQADELRTKRRASLTLRDSLTESIFLDMFGDADLGDGVWPEASLGDLLSVPLRNGVSPATGGAVVRQVLTLSAVTRGQFDAEAVKSAQFATDPPYDRRVATEDLLICRGNGNVGLVGQGRRPPKSMPKVVFPDTMIAARVDPGIMAPVFLEHVWNRRSARRQLEARARTTNGTHKVNQRAIESVVLPVPPVELQALYARRVAMIETNRETASASVSSMDALFASLQHRTFAGEL